MNRLLSHWGFLFLYVSFSLSCFSHSSVLSLSVCVSCPPNLLRAYVSNRTCEEERSAPFFGPPGVVSDGEAVPVVLCIQWKEQGQRGFDCISWASSFIKILLFLPPPLTGFHDPWNALRGCRNSRWLTGGAPNTSSPFLFLLPSFSKSYFFPFFPLRQV